MSESEDDATGLLDHGTLVERLADIEHERWSHWQRYLHSRCERAADGSLTIPAQLVHRWESQMNRSYSELTEEEKESDREQVRRYLPIITEVLEHPAQE